MDFKKIFNAGAQINYQRRCADATPSCNQWIMIWQWWNEAGEIPLVFGAIRTD
jgi:hypothetical protein